MAVHQRDDSFQSQESNLQRRNSSSPAAAVPPARDAAPAASAPARRPAQDTAETAASNDNADGNNNANHANTNSAAQSRRDAFSFYSNPVNLRRALLMQEPLDENDDHAGDDANNDNAANDMEVEIDADADADSIENENNIPRRRRRRRQNVQQVVKRRTRISFETTLLNIVLGNSEFKDIWSDDSDEDAEICG